MTGNTLQFDGNVLWLAAVQERPPQPRFLVLTPSKALARQTRGHNVLPDALTERQENTRRDGNRDRDVPATVS